MTPANAAAERNGELAAFPSDVARGVTKHELFAALAMAAKAPSDRYVTMEEMANWSVRASNALLRALAAQSVA